ncbi:MAG: hypothetical protein AAGH99_14065 [Planctomycetota bacterium]
MCLSKLFLLFVFLFLFSCNDSSSHGEAITASFLKEVDIVIENAVIDGNTLPLSADNSDLVLWLEANSKYFRYSPAGGELDALKDYWGTNLVLLNRDGQIYGIASCGPNCVWEDGLEDDIVHYFQWQKAGGSL